MDKFVDKNGATVILSFEEGKFSEEAKHVLVVCKYGNSWLLTKHKQRGYEFPGGKVEHNESLIKAAEREVFEETGALVDKIVKVGSYQVVNELESFVKAIFFAEIKELTSQATYYETDGPVLVKYDQLLEERFADHYSFIMKDNVVGKVIEKLLSEISFSNNNRSLN